MFEGDRFPLHFKFLFQVVSMQLHQLVNLSLMSVDCLLRILVDLSLILVQLRFVGGFHLLLLSFMLLKHFFGSVCRVFFYLLLVLVHFIFVFCSQLLLFILVLVLQFVQRDFMLLN